MMKRSEGVRRIVHVISVLLVIIWISWVGVESSGFEHIKPMGWLLFAGGIILAYLAPHFVCRGVYWIIDGFQADKET